MFNSATVAQMFWEELTIFHMDLRPTPQVETYSLHCYWDLELETKQVMDPGGEANIIIFLNEH